VSFRTSRHSIAGTLSCILHLNGYTEISELGPLTFTLGPKVSPITFP